MHEFFVSGGFTNAIGKIDCDASKVLDDVHDSNASTSNDGRSNGSSGNNTALNDALHEVSALIGRVNAESTSAVNFAGGAVLPADGTVTRVASLARRVAESAIHLLVWSA